MSVAHPLGLLALLALPLVWWLHRHVVQARRREVSCLALWVDRELVRHEGAQRQRVPDRVVLLLELLAVLALSALLAGLDFSAPAAPRAGVGLVIDGSASMSGGGAGADASGTDRPLQQVRALLAQLVHQHGELAVSIVVAAELPELLGERVMSAAQADKLLAAYEPHGSACNLAPALELMGALGVDTQSTLVFSDDPALAHPRLVRVGRAVSNTAIVAAGWDAGAEPFVVVQRWSVPGAAASAGARVKLQVDVDGVRARNDDAVISLPADGAASFALPVQQGVQRVDIALPDDALPLDNHVTLLRPVEARLRVRNAAVSEPLARAVAQAVRAIPTLLTVTIPGSNGHPQPTEIFTPDLAVNEGQGRDAVPVDFPPVPSLVFLTSGKQKPELAVQPQADPFAALLSGFDGRDLIWVAFARTPPPGARVLLQSDRQALIWQSGQSVYVNVDLEHSNLLAHATFPILLANFADEIIRAQGGLPRRMFHQGERLRFAPLRGSEIGADVRTPSGRSLHFERNQTIDLGVLAESGVYWLDVRSSHEPFAVSLLNQAESELTRRKTPDLRLPALAPSARAPGRARSQLRVPLLLALLLACGLAFLLLERGGGALPFRRAATRAGGRAGQSEERA